MSRNFVRRAAVCAALAGILCGGAAVASARSMTVTSQRLGVVALPVTITTTSLTSVADTGANQASPNTNTGTAATMLVTSASAANQRSFVRFDLSGIPVTARVQVATLQLTMSTAPTASRTYEVDKVNAAWGESTLTWTNMPAAAGATARTPQTRAAISTIGTRVSTDSSLRTGPPASS